MAGSFKDLVVWQKAVALSKEVIMRTWKFPEAEKFALGDQIRRAIVSIPSNIAEGQQRHSRVEFRRSLRIARGSLGEIETQLIIAKELGYLSSEELAKYSAELSVIGKLLNGLITSLDRNSRAAGASGN
jgi:four helix bundle protein